MTTITVDSDFEQEIWYTDLCTSLYGATCADCGETYYYCDVCPYCTEIRAFWANFWQEMAVWITGSVCLAVAAYNAYESAQFDYAFSGSDRSLCAVKDAGWLMFWDIEQVLGLADSDLSNAMLFALHDILPREE